MYNGRLVYVRRVLCELGKAGRAGWAYLCLDTAMRRELERDAADAQACLSGTEAYDAMGARPPGRRPAVGGGARSACRRGARRPCPHRPHKHSLVRII